MSFQKSSQEDLTKKVRKSSTKPIYLTSKNDTIEEACESSDESSSDEEGKLRVPEYEPIGSWGTYGVNEKVWCDKYRPVVKFKKYEDLILNDLEKTGYLSDRIIASCSSYLENCPIIRQLVLCKCVLNDKRLKNVEILKYHQFLQYLDLSWNSLDDVSAVGYLSYLMYLDVSYNIIENLLDFKPPHNLTYVNYSYNLIGEIKDLSDFWSIKTLNLSHNHISVIQGLDTLKYLENLDLSYNQITLLENLDYLNIVSLNLQNNQIDTCVCDRVLGFKSMPFLTYVRLGRNKLKSLNMCEGAAFLQSLEIQDNELRDLLEISYLNNLNLLISVNFSKNPIASLDNYKNICLATIKKLRFLDGESVEIVQKLHSDTTFTSNIKIKAREDFTNLLTLSHLTKLPSFGLNVIPCDEPPRPILIIVSPVGSRQEKLIKEFTHKNPDHIIRLINYTDRDKRNDESEDDYYFVNKKTFAKLLRDGELLMLFNVLDDYYGLSQEEYDRCLAEPGKVLITHTDLNAALAFRMRGFRPILILAIPETEAIHRQWLMEDFETFVYHLRYPEAAIQVTNRENSVTELTAEFSNHSVHTESTQKPDTSTPVSNDSSYQDFIGLHEFSTSTLTKAIIFEPGPIFSEESTTDFNCTCTADFPYSHRYNEIYEEYESEIEGAYTTSLEEYPPVLIENFYKKVIETRELYLEFHRQNPGIFYDTVHTNNSNEVLEKLKNAAKFAIRGFLARDDTYDDLSDHYTHNIVQNRLHMYRMELKQSLHHTDPCKDEID